MRSATPRSRRRTLACERARPRARSSCVGRRRKGRGRNPESHALSARRAASRSRPTGANAVDSAHLSATRRARHPRSGTGSRPPRRRRADRPAAGSGNSRRPGSLSPRRARPRCRNCGSASGLNLHHIIPRSMWKAGITNPLNGVPLCVRCHMGWHTRAVAIYRDISAAAEWACVSGAKHSAKRSARGSTVATRRAGRRRPDGAPGDGAPLRRRRHARRRHCRRLGGAQAGQGREHARHGRQLRRSAACSATRRSGPPSAGSTSPATIWRHGRDRLAVDPPRLSAARGHSGLGLRRLPVRPPPWRRAQARRWLAGAHSLG